MQLEVESDGAPNANNSLCLNIHKIAKFHLMNWLKKKINIQHIKYVRRGLSSFVVGNLNA